MQLPHQSQSLGEAFESVDARRPGRGWRRFAAYVGPAYLVSVGYMDPGNWATDLQGGAQFGYKLIWVLLMSNLMALLLQTLAARMGIVARRDLAQANREMYPRPVNFCLWVLAELAIAATDLAEVLGMALGLYLLTGLPLIWGVCITVLDTFLFLALQQYGIRKMEAFIIALVAIIGISFGIELFLAKPDLGEVAKGLVPTAFTGNSLYLAIGIIGATVMPHNLYLHSALVQTRKIPQTPEGIRQAIKYNFIDSTVALNLAFLVNSAILILAATVFFKTGNTAVAKIEDAHLLLDQLLGSQLAPILFAVALIAAGQSSTVTGTLAGQIVMEGYLSLRLNPMLRRLITRLLAIVPAVLVILIYGEEKVDALLVFSQVILSLQLGFAIIPLIHFVRQKKHMGHYAIKPWVQALAWLVAAVLVALNVKLVAEGLVELMQQPGRWAEKSIAIVAALAFAALFGVMTLWPLLGRQRKPLGTLHAAPATLPAIDLPVVSRVAVALDFGHMDAKVLAHALQQGGPTASYLLMHVVETVASGFHGPTTDDREARDDQAQLARYAQALRDQGYAVEVMLGYQNRVQELARITTGFQAQLLVIGAHRHSGFLDFFYGETVDKVRHKLQIPMLVVS